MANKRYIGDAVYVEWSPSGELVMTTEDGIRATNTIILEPPVLKQLLEYVEERKRATRLTPSALPYTCPHCHMTSHNLHDAEHRYCGACHKFEDEPR